MRELLQRLKAETPAFFKGVRALGLALATAGATILSSNLPEKFQMIAGYFITAGAVMTSVASLAKVDSQK